MASPTVSYCLISALFTPRVRILRKGRVYTLGREPSCDFPLPSEIVSRRHAELEWAPKGGFAIRDLGSKNGTRVGNQRVEFKLLEDGDKIWVGPFCLEYREYQGDVAELLREPKGEGDRTMPLSREALGLAGAATFAGKFEGSEILEICQLIALNEKEGILRIYGADKEGEIAFRRGEVRRARAGAQRDLEAAMALILQPSGRFEFVDSPVSEDSPFRVRADNLIMEAARLRDEAATNPALPPLCRPPVTEQTRRGQREIEAVSDSTPQGGGPAGTQESFGIPAPEQGLPPPS